MQRKVRILLPWFDREDAVEAILGRTPSIDEDVSHYHQQWAEFVEKMVQADPYQTNNSLFSDFPPALEEEGHRFCERPEVKNFFRRFDWRLRIVDLTALLSFQREVAQSEECLTEIAPNDWQALFAVCLPDHTRDGEFQITVAQDQKAITLSSPNPNLRLRELVCGDRNHNCPNATPVYGFTVSFGAPFVQVVQYGGRAFLRDGYHRCVNLLSRGVTQVPCVQIEADNFDDVGANKPQFFSYDTLFSSHPPYLKYFIDRRFSVEVHKAIRRRIVRIVAEEFSIPW